MTFQDAYPAMSPTPSNMQLLGQLNQVSQDLGGGNVEALGADERGEVTCRLRHRSSLAWMESAFALPASPMHPASPPICPRFHS